MNTLNAFLIEIFSSVNGNLNDTLIFIPGKLCDKLAKSNPQILYSAPIKLFKKYFRYYLQACLCK